MAEFSQALFDAICERIANGESLRAICAEDGMPRQATVFRWLAADKQSEGLLCEQYARAREAQADALFDQVLEIADTPLIGQKRKILANQEVGPEGELGEDTIVRVVEITEGDMIEHRRLQVDARKWMAGKLRPKVYGDKLNLEHEGEVKMTPVINFNGAKTG